MQRCIAHALNIRQSAIGLNDFFIVAVGPTSTGEQKDNSVLQSEENNHIDSDRL